MRDGILSQDEIAALLGRAPAEEATGGRPRASGGYEGGEGGTGDLRPREAPPGGNAGGLPREASPGGHGTLPRGPGGPGPNVSSPFPGNLRLILDLPLRITVELGRARLTVRKILELGEGSVVELDRRIGEPVDIFLGEKLIARGEVVTVGDRFGVRIASIPDVPERERDQG